MLCRYRKKGTKQYTFGHKVYKFSFEWTPVNNIRLYKALQSYPDVFDTLHFFDLNLFSSIADKITFKENLIFTGSRTIADKLNGMAYIKQQAYKPGIGEWVFKMLQYSLSDLAAYQNIDNRVNILAHRDLGGIGDIIMTTSVVEKAVEKNSNYKITYACPEQFISLLENNPFITDIKSIKSNVTKKDWDVIIDLTSDCIKYEIKNQPNVKLNRVEVFAQKCGFLIDEVPRPKIYLSEKEILKAKEETKNFKLKIGLVLKSNASVRNWPYFKELRNLLLKKYPQTTFLEFCVKKPVDWSSIKKSYPVFERNLREVSALINECDVVISPDTGLAHIASALRVSTVWIFTHIDGKIRTKNYDNVQICQNIPKDCDSKGIPCWYSIPCSKGEIERKKNPLCSLAIKPEYIVNNVDKILSKPNISYCVVYKDNEQITRECISKILKYRQYNDELILVDNGSKSKGFLDDLLKNQQLIVEIRNEKNLGCIIARNQAMKRAKGEFLFTLDNDQYISAISIHRLLNTEGDIVGVEGWSMDNSGWAFKIGSNIKDLAYVGGGGLLVKKSVAEDINYLDEIYAPAWFSDPDFCYKATEKKYKIAYCKNAKIEHLEHKTIFTQTDFDYQKVWKKSHKIFKEKWAKRLIMKKKDKIDIPKIMKKLPILHVSMLSWLRVDKLLSSLQRLSNFNIKLTMLLRVQGSERLSKSVRTEILGRAAKISKQNKVIFTKINEGTAGPRKKMIEHYMKQYKSPYLLTLDDDMIVPENGLAKMLTFLEQNKDFGAVSLGHTRSKRKLRIINKKNRLSEVILSSGNKGVFEVAVMGSASMIVRRSVFNDCSIDDKYHIGMWDFDLNMQMRKRGWRQGVMYDRALLAINDTQGSTNEYRESRYNKKHVRDSINRFQRKWKVGA